MFLVVTMLLIIVNFLECQFSLSYLLNRIQFFFFFAIGLFLLGLLNLYILYLTIGLFYITSSSK